MKISIPSEKLLTIEQFRGTHPSVVRHFLSLMYADNVVGDGSVDDYFISMTESVDLSDDFQEVDVITNEVICFRVCQVIKNKLLKRKIEAIDKSMDRTSYLRFLSQVFYYHQTDQKVFSFN